MRNRLYLNNFFSRDRKVLYIILSIVITLVLTLTVVYATLSTTLNINGNADVTSASWDIYLDNVELNSRSVTTNIPTITDKTTATFATTLSKPGDFYEFTIDVVNNGSIDAMIDSVTKTPELSNSQKKYLNYIVEYENGESITTKQLVKKESFVRLKVKVEFRKDISSSDLPTQTEILNLSFKVNYVQSNDSNDNITIDNNGKLIKVVSGDLETVGSEICIGEECFYVISSDETSVTMLAKYNLYVGNRCISQYNCSLYQEMSGLQDSTMIGAPIDGSYPHNGTLAFSSSVYWSGNVGVYLPYVYDSNSTLYEHVQNYEMYLEKKGIFVEMARLISYDELIALGCSGENYSCSSSQYLWVYSTSYWTGNALNSSGSMLRVSTYGGFVDHGYNNYYDFGVRPVIKISKSEF